MDTSFSTLSGVIAAFTIVFLIIGLIMIAVGVVLLIGQWKFFTKAGQEGWKSIIPFYNNYVLMVDIAGLSNYWFFGLLAATLLSPMLGVVSSVAMFVIYYVLFFNLAKKLHKNDTKTYAILGMFFSGIMLAIEGYSKNSAFDATVPVTENGPFDKEDDQATAAQPAAQPVEQSVEQPVEQPVASETTTTEFVAAEKIEDDNQM